MINNETKLTFERKQTLPEFAQKIQNNIDLYNEYMRISDGLVGLRNNPADDEKRREIEKRRGKLLRKVEHLPTSILGY